ncbi:MAG: 3-dehydroquinate synthase [Gammaproteobacteria bacterium]
MNELRVELGERAYAIHIGQGLLLEPATWAALPLGQSVVVVSDDNVAAHYADVVAHALAGRDVAVHIVTPGENTKRLEEVGRVIDQLVAHGARRDATVLALGGGVVGDLSGFAAACYMRGIDFVQVPTSLLAQVDSSVGGKTGVNHPAGKNLIGAFHQPVAVVIDTDTLSTLPDRELSAGLAEVIKTALLADGDFFAWLEEHMTALRAREPQALASAIRRCCEIKAAVVARDEREAGERMLLNLGHTFGHAIEKVTHYSEWLHGEAVGTGLIMAANLSHRRDELSARGVDRVQKLVQAAGLPIDARSLSSRALLDAMGHDKKFSHGTRRFILLRELGTAFVCTDVDGAMLNDCLEDFCA